VVIALANRGEPAKNHEFDDGYTLEAHDRDFLKDLMRRHLHHKPLKDRIFDHLTLPALEKDFRQFSKSELIKMTPHGLRHAGPSHDHYYHNVAIQDLQVRGRWLALQSCRRYAKPSQMLRQLAALTASQRRRAAKAADEIPKLIEERLGLPSIGVLDNGKGRKRRALA